jgi:site-specific recombinase XerD
MHKADLGTLIEGFFCKRLISQRRASPHTISSYRDTFRLLLAFAQKRISLPPSQLALQNISSSLVSDFLDHLEANRTNTARTRNLRLTAIRSFFRFAALEAPEHGGVIQRVLAIPNKRCQRPLVGFLTRPEIEALLAAVDSTTWIGRRDYAFLLVAMQTGLRLSELTGVRREDVTLGPGAHIHCVGKGRKERGTPLTKVARRVLQAWMKEPWPIQSAFLFPSLSGGRLSSDAVQDFVNKHVVAARVKCPSLSKKTVTPHWLRHTAAMELLQAGVDRSMIALWLGHESVETTQIYLNANLALKEEILAKTNPINGKAGRYRPTDRVLSFLSNL